LPEAASVRQQWTNASTSIVTDIFKHMSGPNSTFVTVAQLDDKLDRQFALIDQVSKQIESLTAKVTPAPANPIASPLASKLAAPAPILLAPLTI
jgi:hypothetical protein